jgi:drug/metabolite transporter (DMT)-like permease
MSRDKAAPYISGITYATIFGFSFMVTKNALDHIQPFHFLGLRFLLAALLMTLLIVLKIVKVNYKGKNIKPLLLLSLLQPISYFIGEIYGVKHISSSQAGMMIALIPIVVVVFSILFLKEYINIKQAICIVLSVAGVLLMGIMQTDTSGVESNAIGFFFILFAVIAGAGFSVTSRKLSLNYNPFELTYVMMLVGAVIFNVLGVIQFTSVNNLSEYFNPIRDLNVTKALLYLSLLSSIVAFGLMNFTLSKIPAARASLFANLTTVISVVAGVVFRDEPFFWYHFLSGIMILTGVIGVNRFAHKTIVEVQK